MGFYTVLWGKHKQEECRSVTPDWTQKYVNNYKNMHVYIYFYVYMNEIFCRTSKEPVMDQQDGGIDKRITERQ